VEISKNPKVFFYDSGLQSLLWLNSFQNTLLGSVFETNIFGELVKKYGRNMIHFWRIKTGQEIDFLIEKESGEIMPMEAKTNFGQFNIKAINTFKKKYVAKHWAVVGIDGEKINDNYLYPWEI
jgi:predicted AAA+ superfamily ATPase